MGGFGYLLPGYQAIIWVMCTCAQIETHCSRPPRRGLRKAATSELRLGPRQWHPERQQLGLKPGSENSFVRVYIYVCADGAHFLSVCNIEMCMCICVQKQGVDVYGLHFVFMCTMYIEGCVYLCF